MIEFGPGTCTDIAAALQREWLETNGIGGYASSSISGANTRRYHGLLTAATQPPLGRIVLLSKVEDVLIVGGQAYELSTNQYPGTVFPDGYKYQTGFRLDPFPVWTYEAGGVTLEKSVFMVYGRNAAVVQWSVKSKPESASVDLALKPLVAFRDHHHLRQGHVEFDVDIDSRDLSATVTDPIAKLTLCLAFTKAKLTLTGDWYREVEYAMEMERGFEFREDLYQPFEMVFRLEEDAVLMAASEEIDASEASDLRATEIERRAFLSASIDTGDEFVSELAVAADQFIVSRGEGNTVIAGYPWFSDWGRDTMIALPGLTISTGQPEIARSILREFSNHISQGMLPNRFPDEGEVPDYNTVDATLWYFEALRVYVEATDDIKFIGDELFEKLVNVIEWHIRGTRYNIHVDTDGLLYAGEPGVQLTWMDAKVGDWVVTPRTGEAVEVQALWYNALRTMEQFSDALDNPTKKTEYAEIAEIAKTSFNGQFWNADAGCLYDVIDNDEFDTSIRPNQILAVSLKHTMLDAEGSAKVIEVVKRDLLTPYGLRSLSPKDPRYVGVYTGTPRERDSSYHQGTVWAWLIGPFIDAYRRVHGADADTTQFFAGFRRHINEAVVGQISEIFDGDPPHRPRGCGAQAWSVAELLRVIAS